MKIALTLLIAGLLAAGSRFSAAEPDLSKLPPPAEKAGLTYAKDIRPIFEASCFNCHGEQRQRAGLRLDSLEAVLKGGEDGKVITSGHSKDSPLVVAVAQLDDETAMPPKRQQRGGGGGGGGFGGRGPGGPGGTNGPGGRGGFGFGPANFVARQMFAQADTDEDQKLTKAEFSALADTWFEKLDPDKAGKVTQEQFTAKFGEIVPAPAPQSFGSGPGGRGPGGQRGGGPGFGPAGFVAPGFFTATDTDKDGSLTRAELKGTFDKWFAEWDSEKSGSLNEEKFRAGLNAALPRPNFGGFGGGAGGRGPGGQGGFGRGMLAQSMFAQGDKDKDQKLSKAELTALADSWFDKMDSTKAGKLSQQQFTEKLREILMPSQGADRGPGASRDGQPPGGGPGNGPMGNIGSGLFTATDIDKDGSLTRAELKGSFEKWFSEWDSENSGALSEEKLSAGLRAVLPQQGGGGFGGGGPGGFGGGGGGAPPKPLTPEQVGLVRAWIDQGAK